MSGRGARGRHPAILHFGKLAQLCQQVTAALNVRQGSGTDRRTEYYERLLLAVSSTDQRNTYLGLRTWSGSHEAQISSRRVHSSAERRALGALEERRRAQGHWPCVRQTVIVHFRSYKAQRRD